MWVDSFSLELNEPLETAHGPIPAREGFLVGIDSDNEIHGIGEATPLPGWTESVAACQTAVETVAKTGEMSTVDPKATPAAAHAVECATMDAQGQRDGHPLAALLRRSAFPERNQSVPTHVPLNATIGDGSVVDTVEQATTAVTAGYDCLKLKVGSRPLEDDLNRVRAVREAVGNSVTIRVDVNGGWDVETAIEAIESLAPLDIAYVEQPLAAERLPAHKQLRNRGVGIAVDESVATHSVESVIETAAADVVVVKPMAVGGPQRATKAAAAASEAGIEPVVTTTIDAVVARTAAVHVAAAIPAVTPCGLATGSLLATDLAADPVEIREGEASVPTGGGLCGDGFASLQS